MENRFYSTTVKYKNSQRGFVKENESSSNLMFKVNPPKSILENNESDSRKQ
jgi:hypothetical protein